MKTNFTGKSTSVTLEHNATFTMIGEKINPVGNKKSAASSQASDYGYTLELAQSKIKAGADVLDVRGGALGVNEVEVLPAVIQGV